MPRDGTLYGNFRFHPVGQGFFYTGRIFSTEHLSSGAGLPYHFFYDCGSSSGTKKLKEHIAAWKTGLNGRIDLGIISHLDADHCNGLGTLLDGKVACGTVLLPYLSPWQRIIIAGRSDEDTPDEYFEFIENPPQFLLSRNVGQVVFIYGGGEQEGNFESSPEPLNQSPDLLNALPDKSPLNVHLTELLWAREKTPDELLSEFVRTSASGGLPGSVDSVVSCKRIRLVNDRGHVSLAGLWQFHFFQHGFKTNGRKKSDAVWSNDARWKLFKEESWKLREQPIRTFS